MLLFLFLRICIFQVSVSICLASALGLLPLPWFRLGLSSSAPASKKCFDYITGYKLTYVDLHVYVFMDARVVCSNAGPVDVVFAVDSSGSISSRDFDQAVLFIGAVVQALTIRTDRTPNGFQVGFVSFADDVDVRFNLTAYTDKQSMLAAIAARYTHGRTNVSEAMRYYILILILS